MMRVVPVANQAGSAGKTTTTVSLAALLGARGRRVLVIDLDAQANATSWLGVDPDEVEASSGDVLLKRCGLDEAVLDVATPGVQLVPASPGLDGDAVELQRLPMGMMRLRSALRGRDEWDVVLVDCPGALSVLTVAALAAATSVVTVVLPTLKEMKGVPRLEETIAEVRDTNEDLQLGAVVPCRVPPSNGGRLYTDSLALVREVYGDLVTPTVRESVRAPESFAHSEPLPVWAPREKVTGDYEQVLEHLMRAGVV